ncbi:hypothetical protein AVEN_261132-1 [Araneus ventricosus]|uniref:Uncharacterized protein n=1 Tax=Araneus ventricosus TaxID=182803 RepID=A0A4Y2J0R9_ARAVE|nr:hypothetical protein AVEN_261132-1 [Araneus ventricosus]
MFRVKRIPRQDYSFSSESYVCQRNFRTGEGKFVKYSKLIQLNQFLDRKGLLRVGGRIRNSNLSDSERYPIILPKEYPITIMLVKLSHLNYPRAGVQTVNSEMRQIYWIIGLGLP